MYKDDIWNFHYLSCYHWIFMSTKLEIYRSRILRDEKYLIIIIIKINTNFFGIKEITLFCLFSLKLDRKSDFCGIKSHHNERKWGQKYEFLPWEIDCTARVSAVGPSGWDGTQQLLGNGSADNCMRYQRRESMSYSPFLNFQSFLHFTLFGEFILQGFSCCLYLSLNWQYFYLVIKLNINITISKKTHLSTSSAVSSLLEFPALQVKTLLIVMTNINVYNPFQRKSAFPVDLRSYYWKEKSLNKTRLGKSLIIV
jgi:hypothetical protein